MAFSDFLKAELRARDWNPRDLAMAARVSRQIAYDWANGVTIPTTTSCGKIAEALGLDLDRVLAEAEHRPAAGSQPEPTGPHAELAVIARVLPANDVQLLVEFGRRLAGHNQPAPGQQRRRGNRFLVTPSAESDSSQSYGAQTHSVTVRHTRGTLARKAA